MKYIDDIGVPALLRAVERDNYDNKGTLSVTTMIRPAWMTKLEKEHWNEIEVKVSDQLFMLFGQAGHTVLERTQVEGDIAEVRLFAEIDGTKISGQLDRLTKDGVLVDFKFCSVYVLKDAMKGKVSEDYVAQLNFLAALCRMNPDLRVIVRREDEPLADQEMASCLLEMVNLPPIRSLKLLMVARDWRTGEAEKQEDYPPRAVVVDIPLWPPEKTAELMKERVRLNTSGSPPVCSPDERWAVPDKWAVMGPKRALRLLSSSDEAIKWAYDEGIDEPRIEQRPGDQWKRCRKYCNVAKFCKPFQDSLEVT